MVLSPNFTFYGSNIGAILLEWPIGICRHVCV
uniref:Uncharacterized protein n=1 Tax=Rhizophora mucronata TaxID=61149 RepID=A0A2P2P6W6_RHIMU